MSKDFELFKEEFKRWQVKFGLGGYYVYFKHEPIDNFADIHINQEQMTATVRVDSEVAEEDKPFRDIRATAKHEAVHLLVGRLEKSACRQDRHVSSSEMYEATEELVNKLVSLIQ